MSSTIAWSSVPASAALRAAASTYGQFSMNMPCSDWNVARACSSAALDRSTGAALDRAKLPTISAAFSPAGLASDGLALRPASTSWSTSPPPESTSALIQTM